MSLEMNGWPGRAVFQAMSPGCVDLKTAKQLGLSIPPSRLSAR